LLSTLHTKRAGLNSTRPWSCPQREGGPRQALDPVVAWLQQAREEHPAEYQLGLVFAVVPDAVARRCILRAWPDSVNEDLVDKVASAIRNSTFRRYALRATNLEQSVWRFIGGEVVE
jgi:hypothetical protein